MDRLTAYFIAPNKKGEFLKELESNGFLYNPHTFEVRSEGLKEPLGVILDAPRHVHLILPKSLGADPWSIRNERQRLKDLADKF